MEIIPVLNCVDRQSIQNKLDVLNSFLDKDNFIHIDISDGTFSNYKNLSDIADWKEFNIKFPIEVHLMVINPKQLALLWSKNGAKRIIIHIETVSKEVVEEISKDIEVFGSQITLAVNPQTSISEINNYIDICKKFLILAVDPGMPGQKFNNSVLDKIKFLKEKDAIIIEVDGGMNLETATEVKNVGANVIASGSFIFNSNNSKESFEKLKNL